MKLNKTIRHIFQEAILDADEAINNRGSESAKITKSRFKSYLKLGEIPLGELDFVYDHYHKNKAQLDGMNDPCLDGLKSEVAYMVNHLNSHYDFKDINGMLIVTLKEKK